jgi:hypothetical protein
MFDTVHPPILDRQRELEWSEKYSRPECTTSQMTPEQLQTYKALLEEDYQKAKNYLDRIREEEPIVVKAKVENIMQTYPEMTEESLKMDAEAGLTVNGMAKKYNKSWPVVKSLLKKCGLYEKVQANFSKKKAEENKQRELAKPQEVDTFLKTVSKTFEGEYYYYQVSSKGVLVYTKDDTENPVFTADKEKFISLAHEMGAIANMGVME